MNTSPEFKPFNFNPPSGCPIPPRHRPRVDSTRFDLALNNLSNDAQTSTEQDTRITKIVSGLQHQYTDSMVNTAIKARMSIREEAFALKQRLDKCLASDKPKLLHQLDQTVRMLDWYGQGCSFEEVPEQILASQAFVIKAARALGDQPVRLKALMQQVREEWLNHPGFVRKIMPTLAAYPSICPLIQAAFWERAHSAATLIDGFGLLALARVSPDLKADSQWMLSAIDRVGAQALPFADDDLLRSASFALQAAKINPDIVRYLPHDVWFIQNDDTDAEHAIFALECEQNVSAKRYNLELIFGLKKVCGDSILHHLPEDVKSFCQHIDGFHAQLS